jgi:hypothetical protein
MFNFSTSRRHLLAVAALTATTAAVVLVPLVATPASAAVINDPPANGHGVIVFPQRDFVHGDGFAIGGHFTVEDWRGGVQVGVSDPFVNTSAAGFDLNHLGNPCWSSVTPDILPGDLIRVVNLDTGEIDQTPTANVIVTQTAAKVGSTVVIKGTAAQADGSQYPAGQLEARVVASTKNPFSDGTRTIRTPAAYDGPSGDAWTATFSVTKNATPLTPADLDLAVASESRGMWLGRNPGLAVPAENTIYEAGLAGGPAAGCTAPSASDAVTATAPSMINVAGVQAGGNLVLTGTSFNAAAGTVSLTDGVNAPLTASVTLSTVASTDPTVSLPGAQTWTAAIPMAGVGGLLDGNLTSGVTLTRVLTTTNADPTLRDTAALTGAPHPVLKDVVAPQPPTASPLGGTYFAPQSVTLTPSDPAHDTVRYTVSSGGAPDPTQSSTVASGQLQVTTSQQLKAASFDPAGNASTVLTTNYVISTPTVPGAPTAVSATPGNGVATVSWTPPTDTGGSAINSYLVDVFTVSGLQSTLGQDAGTATAWTIPNLTNGVAYHFAVRAQNNTGPSPRSIPSSDVTPLAAPTVTARTPAVNATKMSQASSVTVTFSHAVTGVNTSNFTLQNAVTHALVAAGVAPGSTNQWVLKPNSSLAANTKYTATLTGGLPSSIRDGAGNPVASSTWSFATGPGPTVIGRAPALNAAKVSRLGNVLVRFSVPVAGVSTTTFVLRNATTRAVIPAVLSKQVGTNLWTLNPKATLAARTRFTVTLTGSAAAIRDSAGNALVTQSWSFTTAA